MEDDDYWILLQRLTLADAVLQLVLRTGLFPYYYCFCCRCSTNGRTRPPRVSTWWSQTPLIPRRPPRYCWSYRVLGDSGVIVWVELLVVLSYLYLLLLLLWLLWLLFSADDCCFSEKKKSHDFSVESPLFVETKHPSSNSILLQVKTRVECLV